jgi:outer membrane protein, multidrug efflux system
VLNQIKQGKKLYQRIILIFFAALGVAGCVEQSAAPKIEIAIPVTFIEAKEKAAPKIAGDWPKLFGSAELTILSRQAQAKNLDIAAAVARIRQAEAQGRVAGSALYPALSGTSDASRSQNSGTTRSKTGPFFQSVGNNFDLTLNASYQIDFWGKNRDNLNAAELNTQASIFDRDVIALSTAASVANNYFLVLAAQDRLNVARANLATAERVLAAIKGRLAVGTASGLDVAAQETTVAQQRASIPPLNQNVQQTRNIIAALIGRTPESTHIKGGSLSSLRSPSIKTGLPSQLLLRRPDIAAAETRLKAAGAHVDVARKAFLPSVNLSGKAGLQSALLKNLFRPESTIASIVAGLTQPIFDGYNLQGQLDLERARQDELLQDYRKSIISAFADVENAVIAVRLTSEHERLQALAVASARKAYQITEERLREGTIDIVTLLNSQQTLFQTQDALIQIRLQRYQAMISLFQALGGGFERGDIIMQRSNPSSASLMHPLPQGEREENGL